MRACQSHLSMRWRSFGMAHDLVRKPVPTFRDHARAAASGLFAVLLELLLEGGELGERRIGIRLLVAAVGMAAVRLGVILLALSPLDAVALVAAWTVAALLAVFTLDALALTLHALLA